MSGRGKKGAGGKSPSHSAKAPADTSSMFADLLKLQGTGDFDKALKVSGGEGGYRRTWIIGTGRQMVKFPKHCPWSDLWRLSGTIRCVQRIFTEDITFLKKKTRPI